MYTVNFLGFRMLYHWSAVFVMPNFLCNASSMWSWLTASKAANRSIMSTAVICLFSMPHSMLLTNFRRLVLQLWNFCKLIGILVGGCAYHSVWLVDLGCTFLLF